MKKDIKIFFIAGIVSWLFILNTNNVTANSNGPMAPPLDIAFTLDNTPQVGGEAVLKLIVTPLEDMHLDISCALPDGVMPVMESGIRLQPYENRDINNMEAPTIYQPMCKEVVGLWVGPVAAGQTKEFVFSVTITESGNYEFVAVIEALAKWGIKQEVLIINIE
ncbi:MAG: hypothetical protein ABIA97_04635 [Candidatus Omnitrophota bacterium]